MLALKSDFKRFLLPVSLAALGAGLVLYAAQGPATAADTAATDKAPRRCLTGGGYDSKIIDKETVILSDRFGNSSRVKVKGCNLNNFDPLLFVFRGTNQICDPIDIDMSTLNTPGGFQARCFVESVTPLPRAAKGDKPVS
jgi:hypothetical protein